MIIVLLIYTVGLILNYVIYYYLKNKFYKNQTIPYFDLLKSKNIEVYDYLIKFKNMLHKAVFVFCFLTLIYLSKVFIFG